MNNKKLTIILITLLSVLALSLTGFLVFVLTKASGFKFNLNFGFDNMRIVDSYEASVEDIDKIYLKLKSTDVEIKENNDNKVWVEYLSNKDNNAKIEIDSKTIIVNEDNYDLSCFGICNSSRKVILHIPSSYYGTYDINTASGDIVSTKDVHNNINIVSTSGDITLKSVNNINVVSTSGDINIDSVKSKFAVNTTSGDIKIENITIEENSSINTTSGDVIINNNKSNCYVETHTNSGDIHINNSDRKSDIVLNITTTSGDISVN